MSSHIVNRGSACRLANAASIVVVRESASSGSTAATARRMDVRSVETGKAPRIKNAIEELSGHCALGMYISRGGSTARPLARVSPTTPTTVRQRGLLLVADAQLVIS